MVRGSYKVTSMQHTKTENLYLDTTHIINETEKDLVISIQIKIDKRRSDYKKIIDKMIEKQTSPAISIIKEIEKNKRIECKEGKGFPLYTIEDN
ncbi:MAG: hypothetical protein J6A19_08180 [Oscillospiraceae bacterium]|nr:hypothetical protein [Oscillospiraceae bacterium]